MKKVISLFLALLMLFSVATVAFAAGNDTDDPVPVGGPQDPAGETPDTPPVDAQDEGADNTAEEPAKEDTDVLEQIQDIPVAPAKAVLKVGKIVLKLVKVFVKLGLKFGLIDSDELVKTVAEAFGLDPETELPPGTAAAIITLI